MQPYINLVWYACELVELGALNADSCLQADDAPAGQFIQYTLSQWSYKKNVLNWFNAGCAKDSTAELWMDLASKDARKDLHRCVSMRFPARSIDYTAAITYLWTYLHKQSCAGW